MNWLKKWDKSNAVKPSIAAFGRIDGFFLLQEQLVPEKQRIC